jgi:hypothetical protein
MVDDMWHYAGDQSTDVSVLCGPQDTRKARVKHFSKKFVKLL